MSVVPDTMCRHRRFTYNVTFWRVRITIVKSRNTTMHSVCVAELHVTVNYIKIFGVRTTMLLW